MKPGDLVCRSDGKTCSVWDDITWDKRPIMELHKRSLCLVVDLVDTKTENDSVWMKVLTGDGAIGWVRGEMLREV